MANSRSKRNPVTVPGAWLPFSLELLKSRAFAELSPPALKLLMDLCAQLGMNAKHNGDLCAAWSLMQPRGWSSKTTLRAAMRELIAIGLVVETRHHDRRRCALYAVTLWPLDCDLSKLDVKPGCFSFHDWAATSTRSEKPTPERPAKWKSARVEKTVSLGP